ncbi:MAG TPA: hypothetical protein VFQ38_16545 [Longimicrobiales bacterium]|nr:hypothetical protein [Longimicrobiales bacterium]
MRRATLAAVAVSAVVLLPGCEKPLPSAPAPAIDLTGIGPSFSTVRGRAIRLDDQCEPVSFNATVGPGTCSRANGGVTFEVFARLLTQTGKAGAWHITPTMLDVEEGETVPVVNIGGEMHTYTEVEEFGGGFVPEINALAGFTEVAPECAAMEGDFVAPGAQVPHLFDEEGTEKYQCCIHPWMRQVVRVRAND